MSETINSLERERQEWEEAKSIGKYSFIFVRGLWIALSFGIPYFLINIIQRIYRENTSLSYLIKSKIILDYLLEGLFWLFFGWLFFCFILWVYWARHEEDENK